MSKNMSRTFYRMRTNLPSRGATVFLWRPARLPHAGVRMLATAWRVHPVNVRDLHLLGDDLLVGHVQDRVVRHLVHARAGQTIQNDEAQQVTARLLVAAHCFE